MDSGKISLIRCLLVDEWEDDGQKMTSLTSYFPPFVSDLVDDSDEPVHSLMVDSHCWTLAWRPNGKTEDVDGGIDAARKSKENLTIAW